MTKQSPNPKPIPIPILWLIITTVGFTVYANSFSGPFIFDDHTAILENTAIETLWPPTWLTKAWAPENGAHGRPIVNFTLALNYAIGGFNVWGYHLFNITIHILNALILFSILRHTFQSPYLNAKYGNVAQNLSFVMALFWLIHPLQTQCVNYILQRSESIMALFYLLTLYGTIRTCQKPSHHIWPILTMICCALGMASKEVMVTAPIVALLYDKTFFSGTLRKTLLNKWPFYFGLATTWLVLATLLIQRPHGDTIGFATHFGAWDYFKNQLPIIIHYLKRIIWPHPLILDYGFPIPHLPLTQVLPHAVFLTALFIGTLYALKQHTALGFLGICFFIILAPTSSFIPIINEVGAERRMYLPLISGVVLITLVTYEAFHHFYSAQTTRSIWLLRALVIIPMLICAVLTRSRNHDFRSEVAIWETVTTYLPQNPRAWNILGHIKNQNKDYEAAISYFEKSLQQDPNYIYTHYNFGHALTELNRPDEAIEHFTKAVTGDLDEKRLEDWLPRIHNNLGSAYLRLGQFQKAIPHFQKTFTLQPQHFLAHNNLGVAYLQAGQYPKAIEQFQKTLQINPNYTGAQSNLKLAKELLQAQ